MAKARVTITHSVELEIEMDSMEQIEEWTTSNTPNEAIEYAKENGIYYDEDYSESVYEIEDLSTELEEFKEEYDEWVEENNDNDYISLKKFRNAKLNKMDLEMVLDPNSKSWFVYDNTYNIYIDIPSDVLDSIYEKYPNSTDEQQDALDEIVNAHPKWLMDKEYWYDELDGSSKPLERMMYMEYVKLKLKDVNETGAIPVCFDEFCDQELTDEELYETYKYRVLNPQADRDSREDR